MAYQLIKAEDSDNTFLILAILIGILIIFVIYPNIMSQNHSEGFQIDQQVNKILTDTINKEKDVPKIDQRICSKQCCKFIQWPVPFNTKNPIVKDDVLNNFIPSNFACNGGENGGCVCLTKDDYNYLSEHGQN
jgi:hypothetical protein